MIHRSKRNWQEIQDLLDQGFSYKHITSVLPIAKETIGKAIRDGILKRPAHHGARRGVPYSVEEYCLLWNGKEGRGAFLRHIKQKAIESGLWHPSCSECGLTEWRGFPVPLEVDHKDGNKFNNLFENLRLLCRNCHFCMTSWGNKGPVL